MRLAEHRRLLSSGLRETWRRLCRRSVGVRLALTSFTLNVPDRLIVAPTDLRGVDPFIAEEILDGRYPLAGRVLETFGHSPFSLDLPSRAFAERLHSFSWLRHIRANRTDETCAHIRNIVSDWIIAYGKTSSGPAWEIDVVTERVVSWLSHSPLVLQGAESGFYRRFMKSLAYQVRFLRKIADCASAEEMRLRVRIALAMASLAFPVRASIVRREGVRLDREIERQILADGGHLTRNPRAILELLIDLLPLRQTYINLGHDLPQRLIPAIDRMYPALRFFRHQDGDLALFNGATATPASELMSVLRYDETAGNPSKALPYMNYHRLSGGNTVIIVDAGKPPPPAYSRSAHAGCLSFEMSSGQNRFITNCGSPKNPSRNVRQLARSTAAHSTVTLNETSSVRFGQSRIFGRIMTGAVSAVAVDRWDDKHANDWLRASHDGYASQSGLLHEREIGINPKGDKIKARDRFFPAEGQTLHDGPHEAIARFHIHPSISLQRLDSESVSLRAGDGECWQFIAPGLDVHIDEDIFFADVSGIRPSRQLFIKFSPPQTPEIRWMLRRE